MDRIYISALDETPQQQAVNEHLIELLAGYAFDIFMATRRGVAINGDFSQLGLPLDLSKMMLVVFHTAAPSPQMTHEIEQAIHRRIPILALSAIPVADVPAKYLEQFVKVIAVPEDYDDLIHPIMTTINRHFPV